MKKTLNNISSIIIILCILIGIFSACGKENLNNNEQDISTTSHQQPQELSITYDKSKCGLISYKDVDFYANTDGFFKVDQDGTKTICDKKCTTEFTIINNIIYFTVIDGRTELKEDKAKRKIAKCSVWKMMLDGSNQEKVFDVEFGNGCVVYADETVVIYLGDAADNIYGSIKGYDYLYRYNVASKTTERITENYISNGYGCNAFINGNDVKILYSCLRHSLGLYVYDVKSNSVSQFEQFKEKTIDIKPISSTTADIIVSNFPLTDGKFEIYSYNAFENTFKLEETKEQIDNIEDISANGAVLFSRYIKSENKKYYIKKSDGTLSDVMQTKSEMFAQAKLIDDDSFLYATADGQIFLYENGEKREYANVDCPDGCHISHIGNNVVSFPISDGEYDNIENYIVCPIKLINE